LAWATRWQASIRHDDRRSRARWNVDRGHKSSIWFSTTDGARELVCADVALSGNHCELRKRPFWKLLVRADAVIDHSDASSIALHLTVDHAAGEFAAMRAHIRRRSNEAAASSSAPASESADGAPGPSLGPSTLLSSARSGTTPPLLRNLRNLMTTCELPQGKLRVRNPALLSKGRGFFVECGCRTKIEVNVLLRVNL